LVRSFRNARGNSQKQRGSEDVPRVCGRQSLRTNVPADTPKQYYLRSVAIPFIDALKEQLETRFSRDGRSPIAALLQLVPRILSTKSTDDLVDKLLFYEDDLPIPTSLRSEVISWHRKWRNVQQDASPDNFVEAAKPNKRTGISIPTSESC